LVNGCTGKTETNTITGKTDSWWCTHPVKVTQGANNTGNQAQGASNGKLEVSNIAGQLNVPNHYPYHLPVR
jgi:hypothetical protein